MDFKMKRVESNGRISVLKARETAKQFNTHVSSLREKNHDLYYGDDTQTLSMYLDRQHKMQRQIEKA